MTKSPTEAWKRSSLTHSHPHCQLWAGRISLSAVLESIQPCVIFFKGVLLLIISTSEPFVLIPGRDAKVGNSPNNSEGHGCVTACRGRR